MGGRLEALDRRPDTILPEIQFRLQQEPRDAETWRNLLANLPEVPSRGAPVAPPEGHQCEPQVQIVRICHRLHDGARGHVLLRQAARPTRDAAAQSAPRVGPKMVVTEIAGLERAGSRELPLRGRIS